MSDSVRVILYIVIMVVMVWLVFRIGGRFITKPPQQPVKPKQSMAAQGLQAIIVVIGGFLAIGFIAFGLLGAVWQNEISFGVAGFLFYFLIAFVFIAVWILG